MRPRILGALLAFVLASGCADDPAPTGPTIRDVHGLGLDAEGRLYVATHHGIVAREPEGAWRDVTVEPFDAMGFALDPHVEGAMWASGHPATGGNLGLVRSEDGGATWRAFALGGQVDFHAIAPSGALAARLYAWDHPEFWRSDDGGRTWNTTTPNGPRTILSLAADAHHADRVLAAGANGVWASEDAGRTWRELATGHGVASALALAPSDGAHVYAFLARRGLVRSDDHGATWRTLDLPRAEIDDVVALTVHPDDPNRVVAATHFAGVYASSDAGATWSEWRRSDAA